MNKSWIVDEFVQQVDDVDELRLGWFEIKHILTLAIIIEDKTGLKKNSLFGTEVAQTQDTIDNFCAKIAAGKAVQRTDEFTR